MKTIPVILFVTVNTIASQLILKMGIQKIQGDVDNQLRFIGNAILSPYVWLALALQGVGYLAWMFVVARMKLGVAFAISGAFFYILMALASWVFYREGLSPVQWIGIALVSTGVVLLTTAG